MAGGAYSSGSKPGGAPDPEPGAADVPVVIVGGGPVGLVLAMLLDRMGVQSVVFNKEKTTRWHPKGSTHNARTMEHYRRLGIAAPIRKLGLPADHPTDVVYFTTLNRWELARIPMPSTLQKLQAVRSSARTDQQPEPIHRANQMYVERFLLDHARSRPSVTTCFGWRVERFVQQADHVAVEAVEPEAGRTVSLKARYLVGCDGGQGSVRRELGIRYGGMENLRQSYLGGRMVSTHLKAPALYRDILKAGRGYQYWAVTSRFRNTLVALNGEDEFLFWSTAADDVSEPDDAEIARLFQRCVGADIPVQVLGHSPWTAGVALVADSLAAGRVFLAGDSAHLFTPTGGFGMNTGIDDAANLAWKLAAAVQGWGGPNLLASYELERAPVAHRNTAAARKLAMNVGGVDIPAELEQDSSAGAVAREVLGRTLSGFGEEFASLGVQLGARYDGSPIVASDAAPPADDFVAYRPSTVPGGRLPHLWVGEQRGWGDSIFDRLGTGFTLIRAGCDAPSGAGFTQAAQELGIPFDTSSVPDDEARDFYGRSLILVRPDQHIAWRGNSEPGDCAAVLRRVVGY